MGAATKATTAPITVTSAGVYAIKGTEDGYAYSAMATYIAFKKGIILRQVFRAS